MPVVVLAPQKFAVSLTLGVALEVAAVTVLRGAQTQLKHLLSSERLPSTAAYGSSAVLTLYAAMVLHSYLLSLLFSAVQVVALAYYMLSYVPGGAAGFRLFAGMAWRTAVGALSGRRA